MSNKPLAPLIVGILFILTDFLLDGAIVTSADSALLINIFIILVKRIITVMMLNNYCELYNMNKTRWIIFGIIFGGWTLIVFNITLWAKKDETEEEV